jgi:hypothetical protein
MTKFKKKVYLILFLLITTQVLISIPNSLGQVESPRTSQSKIFDGMFANYTFELYITSYREANSGFKYVHQWRSLYNVTWWIDGNSTHTWHENSNTRLTSNASIGLSFGNNVHTPVWIFTNHTIGDLILIAVDADGERIYNITGDQTYDHPIYGLKNVWVLQNLFFRSSIAYYEKRTGLLIDGNFVYGIGRYNYNLTLTDTNIFSHYQENGGEIPPLYILIIIIAITGIFIILIAWKRKLS